MQLALSLIEKGKKVLDNKGFRRAILKDLSKAFGTTNGGLLIPKLHTYDCDKSKPTLLFSHLNNTWHRTKNNQNFSSWEELLQRLLQGSDIGPLLFNIF